MVRHLSMYLYLFKVYIPLKKLRPREVKLLAQRTHDGVQMRSFYLDPHSTPVLPIPPSLSCSLGQPTRQSPLLSSVTGHLHPISGFLYWSPYPPFFPHKYSYSHHGWKWSTRSCCTLFFWALSWSTLLAGTAVRWDMDYGFFSSATWYAPLPILIHTILWLPILIFSTALAKWIKYREPRRGWRRNRDPEWTTWCTAPPS